MQLLGPRRPRPALGHFFAAAPAVSWPWEGFLPTVLAWGVLAGAAARVTTPVWAWTGAWFGMLLLAICSGLARTDRGRFGVFHAGLAAAAWAAWPQPGWPHAWALAGLSFWAANAVAWLWLRARETVLGVGAILVALHLLPLLLGWPGMLLGWGAVGLLLVSTTLRPQSVLFGAAAAVFPTTRREVCLTIDDGPTDDTEAFLSELGARGHRAVFFLIGDRAAAHPVEAQRIQQAGHVIGNHTQTHPAYWFWSYAPQRLRQEMERAQETLHAILGKVPRLFRAPAGFRNPFCNVVAEQLGLEVAGWHVRGRDGVCADVPQVLARLRRGLRPGAILLIHQGLPQSLAVLQGTLRMLEEEGYAVVIPSGW